MQIFILKMLLQLKEYTLKRFSQKLNIEQLGACRLTSFENLKNNFLGCLLS